MSITQDIKNYYRRADVLLRLVLINVAVFVLLRVVGLLGLLLNLHADVVLGWLEMPSDAGLLMTRPWTVVTYMFCHYGVLHILFNMLWLYWLGRIFLDAFSPRQLVALYVLGGLGGALCFALGYAFLPYFAGQQAMLMGASASILAIVVGVSVVKPDYRINLFLLGSVSLKWMAIITVGILLLSTGDLNAGAQLAHMGGLLVGVAFGMAMRRGTDITRPLIQAWVWAGSLFSRPQRGPQRPRYHYQPNRETASAPEPQPSQPYGADGPTEDEIDAILAKLKQSGYGALTDEEKEKLFSASSKK